MDSYTSTQLGKRVGEVIDRAIRGKPSLITRSGRPAAVVLDVEEYRRMRTALGEADNVELEASGD